MKNCKKIWEIGIVAPIWPRIDSIAASLFVWNWLSWQIVLDDKIQITILILRRVALSTRDHNWSRISRNRSWDWCLGGLIDHSPEFTRIGVEIVGMGEGGPGRLTVVKSREKAVYGLGRGNAASSPEMILISGQTTIYKLNYRAKSYTLSYKLTYVSKSSNL